MRNRITYIAWFSLLAALGLWGAVLYAAFWIQGQAAESAHSAAQSAQQLDRLAYTQRLSALASDTKDARLQLERLVQPDAVTIVNTIESAGKSARVNATVSDAISEGASQQLPGGASLQAVAFIVQAQGAFLDMMKLAGLFEQLPLMSVVEQLNIERSTGGDTAKASSWRMTARIRVLTTAISP